MSDDDSNYGNFLAGFVIGGLIGAAAALLLAPQSGEETRAAIREKGIEIKDRAVETAEEARMRAEKALEDARVRADQAVEEVRMRADEVARLTRERVDDQRTRIGSAVEAGKKAYQETKEESLDEAQNEPPAPAAPTDL